MQGGKCMLVGDNGPDVLGKVSDVIAHHGCCAGYEANYDKLHDTRPDAEDPEKNKENHGGCDELMSKSESENNRLDLSATAVSEC